MAQIHLHQTGGVLKMSSWRSMNKQHFRKGLYGIAMLLLAFGTVACGTTFQQPSATPGSEPPKKPDSSITFMHIHGLGYSADGSEVYIPAHNGLAIYRQGKWSYASGYAHDYMGFSMVDSGFYSSGHPAPDSGLKNPLGIVKSSDLGKTSDSYTHHRA
ncbi:MAG: hypothetical protein IRY98_12110, partial [Alicyclobacillaceae bacterium]|nr:hypothetical protein [Alicyclobacillaceae bacterium]